MQNLVLGTALRPLGEEVEGEAFLLTTSLLEEEGVAVVKLHPYQVEVGVDVEAEP